MLRRSVPASARLAAPLLIALLAAVASSTFLLWQAGRARVAELEERVAELAAENRTMRQRFERRTAAIARQAAAGRARLARRLLALARERARLARHAGVQAHVLADALRARDRALAELAAGRARFEAERARLVARTEAALKAAHAAGRRAEGLEVRLAAALDEGRRLRAERERLRSALSAWLRERSSLLAGLFEGADGTAAGRPGGRGGPFLPDAVTEVAGGTPSAPVPGLVDGLERLRALVRRLPLVVPVEGAELTSGFGRRIDPFRGRPARHEGIDLAAPRGTPVRAPADGRVVRAGRLGAYGLVVELDHGGGLRTRYAHLSRITVRSGQKVVRGQELGRVGSTGRSTGAHLHFEVRVAARPVDPLRFFEAARGLAELGPELRTLVGALLAEGSGPTPRTGGRGGRSRGRGPHRADAVARVQSTLQTF